MVSEVETQSPGCCTDCGETVWWEDGRLVTFHGNRWCYGPDRQRIAMERWHVLPGMAQYVVPAPEGKVCHCLDRGKAHIHQIVEVASDPA